MREALLVCAGSLLFAYVRPEIIAERGNASIGGEVFLTVLPLLLYATARQAINKALVKEEDGDMKVKAIQQGHFQ